MREPAFRLMFDEVVFDGFAGGGGAGLGIEQALGRKVDVAVNHDPEAIAMYKANHPETDVYIEDIYDIDPLVLADGRPVGLAWFSPDCTEHSRAKNSSIKRDKKIRCLANVIPKWAASVRPRVIVVENVLEFQDWGPLNEDDRIDKLRKGEFFRFWWRRMEDLGYRGELRALKACDHGAPTTRERAYIIWRCDGAEICWPEITHGPGRPLPWRTAAECIDYSLPCPSIFMGQEDAAQFYVDTGIRCKRPLEDNTLARIGRGAWKYVINEEKPFIIPVTHPQDQRVYDIDEPMRTITGAARGELAYVAPFLTPAKTWGGGGNEPRSIERPVRTITTSKRGEYALVAPTLIQTGYGERPGQAPRCLDIRKPLGTVVSGGTGGVGKHALVAAFLTKHYSQRDSGGWNGGSPLNAPMGTITGTDHHALTASYMMKFRGTSDAHMSPSSSSAASPIGVVSANGNHHAEVRAFLMKYHGERRSGEMRGSDLRSPMPTIDTSNRFGLVTVNGDDYMISDIGMRMLVARELYRAQGFPDSYIIDPMFEYRYVSPKGRVRHVWKPLTKTAQTEKCGNSVSPVVARAIIAANFSITARETAPLRRAG